MWIVHELFFQFMHNSWIIFSVHEWFMNLLFMNLVHEFCKWLHELFLKVHELFMNLNLFMNFFRRFAGSGGYAAKRGYKTFGGFNLSRFLFPAVPSSQKDRGLTSSNRFVGAQSIHRLPDFSNGHSRECKSFSPRRNVGNIHRLERCLFSHPNSSQALQVP